MEKNLILQCDFGLFDPNLGFQNFLVGFISTKG